MKRMMAALLCIILTLGAVALPVVAAGNDMPTDTEIINTLGVLEIMNGDENGNLNLEKNVTRAEFVKMALCASSLKDSVNSGSNISVYTDVRASHWAIGYVTTAVNSGYIKGYLDGTFRPSNTIKLEEAVAVLLRVMGYSEVDSGKYPETHLAKYSELKLGTGVATQRGEALTRRDCMYLIYNALCAKAKSGKVYCETLGYSADEAGRIDFMALVRSEMKGPYVLEAGKALSASLPFSVENATFYRDNAEISASDVSVNDVYYYIEAIDTVWVFSDKITGAVEAVSPNRISPTGITVNGTAYTLEGSSAKNSVSNLGNYNLGDMVTLLIGKDGGVVKIVDADAESVKKYGYVTNKGSKTFTKSNGSTYTADTVEILALDGKKYTYEYKNSHFNLGDFVSVSYNGGSLSVQKENVGVSSARAEEILKLVKRGAFAENAEIVDAYITTRSDSIDSKDVNLISLYPARFDGAELRQEYILYASVVDGKIETLVLDSFTGDIYTYGIVMTEKNGNEKEYTYIDTHSEKVIKVNASINTPDMGAAKFTERDGTYTVSALEKVKIEKENLYRSHCVAGGKTYKLAANVKYFVKTAPGEFEGASYENITAGDFDEIFACYDKPEKDGGRVRVILAQ